MIWQQINPINSWLVIKRDEPQYATKGGIIITEQLPMAANLAYFTGNVLKISAEALEYINLGRNNKYTVDNIKDYKVVYRQYLSEVITLLNKDEDNLPVFMMQAKDIVAIVDSDTKVRMI